MKKSAVIAIGILSVVVLLLSVLLVWGISYGGKAFGFLNFSMFGGYPDSNLYTVGDGEVSGNGIKRIDVNWVRGSVDVKVYGGNTIKFTETGTNNIKEKYQMRYLVKDEELIIQFCKSGTYLGFPIRNASKKLEILIPEKIAKDLQGFEIDVVSAPVNVTGIGADTFSAETVSGKLTMADIRATNMNIESVSADVILEEFTCEGLDIETVSGKTDIYGTAYNLKIETVSGKVNLDLLVCPSEIEAESISGAVSISIPDNEGFTVDFDTVSGKMDNDFETVTKRGEYIYGNGKSRFYISTVSGKLNIIRNN